jgi:hypothetical protein
MEEWEGIGLDMVHWIWLCRGPLQFFSEKNWRYLEDSRQFLLYPKTFLSVVLIEDEVDVDSGAGHRIWEAPRKNTDGFD